MARKILFDIEADGFLDVVTTLWCLIAWDLETQELFIFGPGDMGWVDLMNEAELVVGHNILGFDLLALEKLFGYKLRPDVVVQDTLLMSQALNYRRFGHDGHSLEAWGEALGFHKIDWRQCAIDLGLIKPGAPSGAEFKQFHPDMLVYCEQDVRLNVQVYETTCDEYFDIVEQNPQIRTYLRAEHFAARWSGMAEIHGWPFDKPGAEKLQVELDVKLDEAYKALSSKLGLKIVPKDKSKGVVEWKEPKWKKDGSYQMHTAEWFGVDPWSGFAGEERMIDGPYSRLEVVPLSLDSVQDVKTFLFRNGWVPTEYNWKPDPENPRKKLQGAPKITEDSLEFLGGDGKLYMEFLTAKSRAGVVKTWLKNVDEKGNLHGDSMLIGTPSMRSRHQIIVNVPTADSVYGKEMRSLFGCLEGWTLIGCDSKGNQARGLAHYLGDPGFIDTLLNGDIHTYNANILDKLLWDLFKIDWGAWLVKQGMKADEKHTLEENIALRKRGAAKRILYAFLFGASGGKLWSYIFGVVEADKGNKLKNGFVAAVPGFKKLLDKLKKIYGSTAKDGYGYIYSLAGNRIYVDSTHKLLVYLLQSAEKITCSTAIMLTMQGLEEAGIPYIPCIYYHDEIDFMVPNEYAEKAAEIGVMGFREGPKLYGVEIMDGDSKTGRTWLDVH